MMIMHAFKSPGLAWLAVFTSLSINVSAYPPEQSGPPKASPVPKYAPRNAPVVTGEFIVGVVNITFKETVFPEDVEAAMGQLLRVTDTHLEADPTGGGKSSARPSPVNLDEYFKIYSNDIAWPKVMVMPDEKSHYQDPQFYGYYCEFDPLANPIGWKDAEEGANRVKKMNQEAMRFAAKDYRGAKPRFICYNYITRRPDDPDEKATRALFELYPHYVDVDDVSRKTQARIKEGSAVAIGKQELWASYAPVCKWGEPAWPNSKIQINDFAGGVLAHEIGHCLGAPDVYRIGRFNDGIGGDAGLLAYGPTANAFSRFYHHAYIKEENHPLIKSSGTYTLHPRHIKPAGREALGYLIPSNHPHYMYHVEYIHDENSTVGVGPSHEGMLISVINLGLTNYLGSPDYTYVYRPNDPFFRGHGDKEKCLFGKAHGRTEFNMTTEPSSRLPNLMDGGVYFKNIAEKDGTMSFEVVIDRKPVTGSEYANSMLPQIRLDQITDVQSTSFTMDCTIKFRGEPLKTIYGFCWGTSKNPTVKQSTYVLAHRECYRGHAINLAPGTTYYVRAFASNGVGIRYSDEENMVKTADARSVPTRIGPLLTDSYSKNAYLKKRYSFQSTSGDMDYSSVCAMAKLMAYYRPERMPSISPKDFKTSVLDFNQMNWNPQADHPRARLEQVDGLFYRMYSDISQSRIHELKPDKKWIKALKDLMDFRSKPEVAEMKDENLDDIAKTIKADLSLSRPVVMILSPKDEALNLPARWILIDGVNEQDHFHADVPSGVEMFVDGQLKEIDSGYSPLGTWIFGDYQTHIITSCFYGK